MGQRGHVPQYLDRGDTITSVPPMFEESSQVVFICWFHSILFHQKAYFIALTPTRETRPTDRSFSPTDSKGKGHCVPFNTGISN